MYRIYSERRTQTEVLSVAVCGYLRLKRDESLKSRVRIRAGRRDGASDEKINCPATIVRSRS